MGDPLTTGLGAIGATMHAFNLVKAFNEVRDATKVQSLKFELMGLLLEAQEAQAALVMQKRELEDRVRKLETWESQKQKYELTSVGTGTFAFALKPDAQGSQAPHVLCANCFNHGHPSILQQDRNAGHGIYACPKCKAHITPHSDRLREIGALPPMQPR